ncbi:MAG: hypothetical protein ACM34K_04470 [Bacillota bacterium]
MFLAGILSIFQIIVLPGLILLKVFKIRTNGILQLLLFSMGLSLYSNYILVCTLVFIRLYTAPVIFVIFIAELSILCYLGLHHRILSQLKRNTNSYYQYLKSSLSDLTDLNRIAFISSAVLILFFISLIYASAGDPCYFTDALMNWNKRAATWATNNFPYNTGHYPQMLPANLSLIHIFTGVPASDLFLRIVTSLFFVGNLLIFFDLALIRRSLVHLSGLWIYGIVLVVFYTIIFILDVNADILASFFSFLAYYAIISKKEEHFDIKTMSLVAAFASSAAEAKLAGAYILCISLLWILYITYKNRSNISRNEILRTGSCLFFIYCGSMLWYLVKPADMYAGLDQSVYLAPDYFSRIAVSVQMLYYSAGPVLFFFLLITVAASLFTKEARLIVLFIITPAIILWALFFGADFRNISFAIPFVSYSSAYGLQFIYKKLVNSRNGVLIQQHKRLKQGDRSIVMQMAFIMILVLTIVICSTSYVFNMGINLAYLFNRYYFSSYRILYTSEIGYYKYIEYYLTAIKVLCLILLGLFFLRNLRLRFIYIFLFSIALSIVLNYSSLSKESILRKQEEGIRLTDIHNLYHNIYKYIKDPSEKGRIITNSLAFYKLTSPPGFNVSYKDFITKGDIENNTSYNPRYTYFLFERNKFAKGDIDSICEELNFKYCKVFFDNGDYIFLKFHR